MKTYGEARTATLGKQEELSSSIADIDPSLLAVITLRLVDRRVVEIPCTPFESRSGDNIVALAAAIHHLIGRVDALEEKLSALEKA